MSLLTLFLASAWHLLLPVLAVPFALAGMLVEFVRPEWFGTNGQPYNTSKRMFILFMHVFAMFGLWEFATGRVSLGLAQIYIVWEWLAGFPVTAGLHRFHAHKSYGLTPAGRWMFAIWTMLPFQGTIVAWSRDHQCHHKFGDTDADPYSITLGPWWAHIGWIYHDRHPELKRRGKTLPMDDLLSDPAVRWNEKWYPKLAPVVRFVVPALLGYFFFGGAWQGFCVLGALAWMSNLHNTWMINSLAHMIGDKPYRPEFTAVENQLATMSAMGEGWHNYHHAYPFDYRAAELGPLDGAVDGEFRYNPTTTIIDALYSLGLVTFRKTRDSHKKPAAGATVTGARATDVLADAATACASTQ